MGVLVDGLDLDWLERAARDDPLAHAYAVWDLRHEPDRVAFASYREGGETIAYRLEWHGPLHPPIVHWVGPAAARGLLERWPARPFVAVVPPERAEELIALRGPARTYPIELRALGARPSAPRAPVAARRLRPSDAAAVAAFAAGETDRLAEGYRGVDLGRSVVFGAFEGDRLVAAAKASVVLPKVWILTAILTAADRRGNGLGRAVTEAAVAAARTAGARPALYVRADNVPAVRLYEAIGFAVFDRRTWVDAGADWEP